MAAKKDRLYKIVSFFRQQRLLYGISITTGWWFNMVIEGIKNLETRVTNYETIRGMSWSSILPGIFHFNSFTEDFGIIVNIGYNHYLTLSFPVRRKWPFPRGRIKVKTADNRSGKYGCMAAVYVADRHRGIKLPLFVDKEDAMYELNQLDHLIFEYNDLSCHDNKLRDKGISTKVTFETSIGEMNKRYKDFMRNTHIPYGYKFQDKIMNLASKLYRFFTNEPVIPEFYWQYYQKRLQPFIKEFKDKLETENLIKYVRAGTFCSTIECKIGMMIEETPEDIKSKINDITCKMHYKAFKSSKWTVFQSGT